MDLVSRIVNNRYKIIEKISEDALSNLYLAHDTQDNNRAVSIKFLKNEAVSGRIEDIIRFRSEIERVSEIESDHIVRVVETGDVFGLHYIIMEFQEGRSLGDITRDRIPSFNESLEYIVQICSALESVHEKGIVHRSLKPANIIVTGSTVKITDFGIAHIKEFSDALVHDSITETFSYFSPEQCGIIKRDIDERSDIYSAGVILYEMLTGMLPFTGNDISSLVHQQVARIPDRPGSINADIAGDIDRIVLKLLEKDPENRYQSAAGLRHDLQNVLSGRKDFLLGLNDRSIKLSYRTKLVGRDKEAASLRAFFDDALKEAGAFSLILGAAGSGKTRIVEDFRDYVYSREGLFLSGKCFEGENKTPYAPFSSLLSSFLNIYRGYSEAKQADIREKLNSEFGDFSRIIINMNPAMEEVFVESPALKSLETESENKRFLMVVSRFIKYLGHIEKGLAVVIEDFHWADDASLQLIIEIVEDICDFPMVLLITCRDDELTGRDGVASFIKNVKQRGLCAGELTLQPFNEETMRSFIAGLLMESGDHIADISAFIQNKSVGNPFIASEILKQLIENKVLLYRDDGWMFNRSPDNIVIPASYVEIVLERVKHLDDKEKEIISYAAVMGKECDLDLLYSISDIETEGVVAIIDRAMSLHILEESIHEKSKVIFVHDRIREAFYNSIDEIERKDMHLGIAAVLEERTDKGNFSNLFYLAHHYIEGGDKDKSIEYAYPAGIMARENFANHDAIKYFNRTVELLEETEQQDSQLVIDCKIQLGSLYVIIGKFDTAISLFNEVLPSIKRTAGETHVYKEISDAYYRKGDWANCEEYASRGLALLKETLPRSGFAVISGIIKELAIHMVHSLLPVLFVRKRKNTRSDRYRMILSFYDSLGMSYALNDAVKLAHASLRILNIAERRIGPSQELAMGNYGFAGLCSAIPLFKRAKKHLKRSLEVSEKLDIDWFRAKALQIFGYHHEWKGEFEKARTYLQESFEIFDMLGDIKEFGMVLNGIEHTYYYMSDYENALAVNNRYHDIVSRVEDYYSLGAALIYYSQYYRETGGIVKAHEYALEAMEMSRDKEIWFNYCSALNELGCHAIELREPDKAIEYLEEARKLDEDNTFLKQYILPVYYNLARAYIDFYIQEEQGMSERTRKNYLAKIRKACSQALKKTGKWATHYGSALHVEALYYTLTEKQEKAKSFFSKSIQHCASVGRKYEMACSLYDYGIYLSQIGETRMSRHNFEMAYQVFRELGSRVYMERIGSLLGIKDEDSDLTPIQRLLEKERILSIKRFSHKIRSIHNISNLLSEVIIKAVELAGAQRGYLFLLSEDEKKLEIRASRNIMDTVQVEYSRSIIDSTFKNEDFVITTDEGNVLHGSLDSSPRGLASVMCIPIRSRYRVIGVCYLANPLSSGIFTDTNAAFLLDFFSQIGISIENALLHNRMKMPRGTDKDFLTEATESKIKKAIDYINEHYRSDISREGLAASLDINPDHLGKAFKVFTGEKLNEYINKLRILDAAKKLKETDDKIIDIAFSVGFESLSTFNRAFLREMNINPKKYRKEEYMGTG